MENTTIDFDKLMRLAAVSVTLVGNKDGVYIDSRNCNARVDFEQAENFAVYDGEVYGLYDYMKKPYCGRNDNNVVYKKIETLHISYDGIFIAI